MATYVIHVDDDDAEILDGIIAATPADSLVIGDGVDAVGITVAMRSPVDI